MMRLHGQSSLLLDRMPSDELLINSNRALVPDLRNPEMINLGWNQIRGVKSKREKIIIGTAWQNIVPLLGQMGGKGTL